MEEYMNVQIISAVATAQHEYSHARRRHVYVRHGNAIETPYRTAKSNKQCKDTFAIVITVRPVSV